MDARAWRRLRRNWALHTAGLVLAACYGLATHAVTIGPWLHHCG